MIFGALVSVALGILSVMILFSLTATALQEAIAQLLNTRGKRLRDGIIVLLETNLPKDLDPKKACQFFYDEFYETANLNSLTTAEPTNQLLCNWDKFKTMLRGGGKKLPSAIEPRRYAEAMLDLIGDKAERNKLALQAKSVVEEGEKLLVEQLKITSDAFEGENFAKTAGVVEKVSEELQTRIDRARSMIDARLQELEDEFNQTMDRVSGWYARQAKMTLFLIGLFLAVGANIDLIGYAQRLLIDEDLRNKAEIYAQLLAESDNVQREAGHTDNLAELLSELNRLEVRVGWCKPIATPTATEKTSGGLCPDGEQLRWPSLSRVIGWFLIAFGVTLGAQFWFNLFRRFLSLRTSGKIGGAGAGTVRKSG